MRKVKWGVLGTAGIAKGQTIPGMRLAENCELYAVAGRNLEKAENFKKEFGFEKAYGSYEELLADEQVEAVYIPLPNTLHKEWTIKALEAKKHVLCEKPLAPCEAEAREMIEAAEKNGVFLMEAFAYLHSPIVQALKSEVDRGSIGKILYMETAFITSDYELSNIRMRKETNGGALYDLGCYNTSQILWMLDGEPEKVMAVSDYSEQGVDVCTSGIMTFGNGARAAFTCGMLLETEADKRIDRLQIHGTKGHIRSEAEFNQQGKLNYTICTDGKEVTKEVFAPQNYSLEVAQLGRCITEGEVPYVSNEFTLKLARTMDRLLEAAGYHTSNGLFQKS
ncbi:Gfo/Idh/MocA family oxidoreductase [Lacrimispora sp. NSJ-141]|uniref:Gfo/Idh/MocA family oxidoreductase n=1 Tax=Lientehia hominis TaxID=2897778 RepID=A0AAP2RI28_9FIRM|nr:Gfo/Idh/MocA family oxidoreductase [Lientehia hominis]MCD2492587.1 Gfo/Idh/MocA family oxidoreductase [Lientehia hominis]